MDSLPSKRPMSEDDRSRYVLPADIAEMAEQVVEANRRIGRRLVLAESCTGGLVTSALTEVPGSSDVFDCGFVTYTNESKIGLLGVSPDIIETFGAVSIACVWSMAQGALARSNADLAVAISGVAGPDGGTDLKPVGTVVFARALRGHSGQPEGESRLFEVQGRGAIRREATICALELLLP
jgi:nicotinamide-nucleotide amidase